MSNVISFAKYKQQRDEEEYSNLADRVMDIIHNLDIDPNETPKMIVTDLDGYNDIGVASLSNIYLDPSLQSCCSTLGWVAYILTSLGENDAANDIDNVITRLENKIQTTRGE